MGVLATEVATLSGCSWLWRRNSSNRSRRNRRGGCFRCCCCYRGRGEGGGIQHTPHCCSHLSPFLLHPPLTKGDTTYFLWYLSALHAGAWHREDLLGVRARETGRVTVRHTHPPSHTTAGGMMLESIRVTGECYSSFLFLSLFLSCPCSLASGKQCNQLPDLRRDKVDFTTRPTKCWVSEFSSFPLAPIWMWHFKYIASH